MRFGSAIEGTRPLQGSCRDRRLYLNLRLAGLALTRVDILGLDRSPSRHTLRGAEETV